MKACAFLYRRPRNIDEAVALLGDNAGDAQVLAGGQSLMPTLNMRLSSPGMLVDINRIGALAGITDRGTAIRIGALVRHADVLDANLIAKRLPLLAMAIPHVAHMAVRNRGTCCGSLALADPSAEIPAVAVALNADIVLQKRGEDPHRRGAGFFPWPLSDRPPRRRDDRGGGVSGGKPDEVFGFSELSRRHGDFATVGVAIRARKTPRGIGHFEIVIFGSEPTPLLSPSAAKLTLDTGVADGALAEWHMTSPRI